MLKANGTLTDFKERAMAFYYSSWEKLGDFFHIAVGSLRLSWQPTNKIAEAIR
ncbi:hypothetical protein [Solitalea canadensis]|uniref:Uncharacterized protein n=1 Tax=Solitalea canadensis (strain ATCC 29591 / DSM 3403 / JCM 21819 / LMG 8368 / NBRC 15130 / NCIMB 12057 / USAM 9D) TaxID=929556 RepID=H8KLF2_SOLCM|nr:hypothetical protein [Solitalea canadensis]AFD08654.1 hypothetical protein Solca_3650 [Solitalea canadensis DSM 3403]